jgi:hypothetical protein
VGKSSQNFDPLEVCKVVEVGVWFDSNRFEILLESRPSESLLCVGCWLPFFVADSEAATSARRQFLGEVCKVWNHWVLD